MKYWLLILSLGSFALAAADLYVDSKSDPNIEPGRDTTTAFGQLYPLVGVPTQVALHPKVLSGLGTLQQMGDKAVGEAKTAGGPDTVVTGAVISAQTWARQVQANEQKFWVFQTSFRKGPKGQPLGAPTIVGHFVVGAYTFYDGKKVFQLTGTPNESFPYLGTFPPKEGEFKLPTPTPSPTP